MTTPLAVRPVVAHVLSSADACMRRPYAIDALLALQPCPDSGRNR